MPALDRRLRTWLDGDLNDLLLEGRTIQRHIPKSHPEDSQKCLARSFANLMFEGKTKAAIRLLTEDAKGGVLCLSDHVDTNRTVKDVLIDKHPSGQPAHPESMIKDDPPEVHPVLFESIDASMIRSAALRTTGAAGPSGLDAASYVHPSNLPTMICVILLLSLLSACARFSLIHQLLPHFWLAV